MPTESDKDRSIPLCIYFNRKNGKCLFESGTPTLARLEGRYRESIIMICRGELSVGISRGGYQKDNCNKYASHR